MGYNKQLYRTNMIPAWGFSDMHKDKYIDLVQAPEWTLTSLSRTRNRKWIRTIKSARSPKWVHKNQEYISLKMKKARPRNDIFVKTKF